MVEFLLSADRIKFASVLASFAEENVMYLNEDFDNYFQNVNFLLSALDLAKRLVGKRIQYRQCKCYSRQRLSFTAVLIKNFTTTSLSDYLINGDDKELDNLKYDVRSNFSSFDSDEVISAFHKMKHFKKELIAARKNLVINPFISVSDFYESDASL